MLKKLFAKLMGSKKQTKRRKSKPSRAAQKAPKKKPAAKKNGPPKPKRKSQVKTKPRKPAPAGDETGRVVAFFRIPVVAVIKVTRGSLKMGDRIWIRGHTTDSKQTITSMQINHQPIPQAKKGDEAGVKVSSRARRGDRVYRLPD